MKLLERLKALFAKARSLARRVVDPFPITPLGLAVIAGAGAAL